MKRPPAQSCPGNARTCRACNDVIHAHDTRDRTSLDLLDATRYWRAAWLAGFCSPACMLRHADAVIAGRTAWWQRRRGRPKRPRR